MFGGSSIERRPTRTEEQRWPMHNVLDSNISHAIEEGRAHVVPGPELESDSTAIGTPELVNGVHPGAGTWGERDVGGPLDQRTAMADYEALRQELFTLSRTRSGRSFGAPGITRRLSRKSTHSLERPSVHRSETQRTEATEPDVEAVEEAEEGDFELAEFMREGHFEKRNKDRAAKKVGVVYRNLTVQGVGSTATFVKTLPNAVIGTFGPDLYHLVSRLFPFLSFGRNKNMRTLINDFTGLVRDGEMMLVLGRPGSGCTTFLKAVANNREEYAAVTGDVSYGGIDAARQKKQFRGEVNYNPEDDVHFPDMNVSLELCHKLVMH